MLFGAVGVTFGIIAGAITASGWSAEDFGTELEICWWVGAAFGTFALVLLGAAVYPKIKIRERPNGVARYFRDLATCKSDEEATAMVRAGARDPASRDIGQARVLAGIVMRKYLLTKVALWSLLLSGVLVIVPLVLHDGH
jgi:hypothetical protein